VKRGVLEHKIKKKKESLLLGKPRRNGEGEALDNSPKKRRRGKINNQGSKGISRTVLSYRKFSDQAGQLDLGRRGGDEKKSYRKALGQGGGGGPAAFPGRKNSLGKLAGEKTLKRAHRNRGALVKTQPGKTEPRKVSQSDQKS